MLCESFDIAHNVQKSSGRFFCPSLYGSSDAYVLAHLARELKARQSLLVVITADANDAQRLLEEIPWFCLPKGSPLSVHSLPDWETLPYDTFSPHQDLISKRLETLYTLQQGHCDVLLIPAGTALLKMAPPAFLAAHTFFFTAGTRLDEAQLKNQLTVAGYQPVMQVMSPGEYAIRGGLIDIFPMGAPQPYRLDLLGDTLESIRTFDVDSQRSLVSVDRLRLLPAREFPVDEAARTAFRTRWRATFDSDPSKASLYKDMGQGIVSAGIEYYLPLFFEETASIFSYLPKEKPPGVFALVGDVAAAIDGFLEETHTRYRFLSQDIARPVLPPETLFLSSEAFFTQLKSYNRWVLRKQDTPPVMAQAVPEVAINHRLEDPLFALRKFTQQSTARIFIVAESLGRRETLWQYFKENNFPVSLCQDYADFLQQAAPCMLGVAPLAQGFITAAFEHHAGGTWAFITEAELYAGNVGYRQRKKNQENPGHIDAIVRDLSELKIADPVVHIHHGVGRYQGLMSLDLGEGCAEFLHLTYANDAQLYVPVAQLHLIARYSGGAADHAPLHALGSGQWEKAKNKAAQQIRDTAAELLNVYARRAARQGHAFIYSAQDYEAFAQRFGFEETADQAAAIAAVIDDMTSNRPMDRLICGDVGFGKTEVALRAAMIAVMGGKQVAILTPTTLLAEQHMHTFTDRFADWPVRLAEFSRFRSGKEITQAAQGLADGSIDIAIGTHKLLSPDLHFARLGLVIIDEEHRFGVRQKEALKALRAEVDILTLTATPIPRTLGMALEGLRDFSIIATAPQKRLAIKTLIHHEDVTIIREACLRELKRGGQVYFLHNDVESIQHRFETLQALLPEARIAIGHGQMHERELEKVMRDFVAQRIHILLCTTIIETGIDVPSANTIVIHRADKFGLAQLHQLRGRVGRSHHQAYAYLLVHDKKGLTPAAARRLEAIQAMEELGSGFYLAMHDLEIRGCGEILGDHQSGEMHDIGFQLYSDMLNKAVRDLKQGKEPDFAAPLLTTTEIHLQSPALLPSDYCADVHERLSFYKRLAHSETRDALDGLQEEIIDRFGKLPEPALALLETHRLRIAAKDLGICKIDANHTEIRLHFLPQAPVDGVHIMTLLQKNKDLRFLGEDKLQLTASMPDLATRVSKIRVFLQSLHPVSQRAPAV